MITTDTRVQEDPRAASGDIMSEICVICNKEFKQLTLKHLTTHGIFSREEYDRYLAKSVSEASIQPTVESAPVEPSTRPRRLKPPTRAIRPNWL